MGSEISVQVQSKAMHKIDVVQLEREKKNYEWE